MSKNNKLKRLEPGNNNMKISITINTSLLKFNIHNNHDTRAPFRKYEDLLLNCTITKKEGIKQRHVCDSITMLQNYNICERC